MKKSMYREKVSEVGASYLFQHGYEILERDWSHGGAHIDYIARDPEENELAFIELCTGDADSHAFPEEDLSQKARIRFEEALTAYATENRIADCHARFDNMAIYLCGNSTACVRHHMDMLRNAA